MRQTKRTFICMNNLADIIYIVYLYLLHKFFQYQEIKYIYKKVICYRSYVVLMLEVSILSISTYFLLFFDTVPTEWYFVGFFNSIVVNVAYFLNTTTTTTKLLNFVEHTMPLKTRFISLLYTYLVFVLKLITNIIIM